MRILLIAIIVWLSGLVGFAAVIPSNAPEDYGFTDGVAVLTGGSGRVEQGMIILEEQLARTMLISGVGGGADLPQLTAAIGLDSADLSALMPFIELDYASFDTQQNAAAVAEWVERTNLRHIRLITSNYHMPRAMLELRQLLPYFPITEHSVLTEAFKKDRWLLHPNSAGIVFVEYHKWLIAGIRSFFNLNSL